MFTNAVRGFLIAALVVTAITAVSGAKGPPRNSRATSSPETWVPKSGFVPNRETAVRIAVAIWIPIFGERQIQSERPYNATLRSGVWTVTGSLPKDSGPGGVALVKISKRDGRILLVEHGM